LAGIGAVAILFNELEALLDSVLYRGLGLNGDLWLETVKRISSFDSKYELALLVIDNYQRYATNLFEAQNWTFSEVAKNTYGQFRRVKSYRDAIVHARVFDSERGIGEKITYKAKIDQILLTTEALEALYAQMVILKRELEIIFGLFDLMHAAIFLGQKVGFDKNKLPPLPEVSEQIKALAARQKQRLSLPPIPNFPD
jgi:hypothetical protein